MKKPDRIILLDSADCSVPRVMLQIFIMPMICAVSGFVVALIVWGLPGTKQLGEPLVGCLSYFAGGFLLGYRVQRAYPSVYFCAGRLVWAIPTLFLLWGVLVSVARWPGEIEGWFVEKGANPGAAMASLLLLWPVIATWGYSAGIIICFRRAAKLIQRQEANLATGNGAS
jgi:hypothetical protein